jgi:hypothetical protein
MGKLALEWPTTRMQVVAVEGQWRGSRPVQHNLDRHRVWRSYPTTGTGWHERHRLEHCHCCRSRDVRCVRSRLKDLRRGRRVACHKLYLRLELLPKIYVCYEDVADGGGVTIRLGFLLTEFRVCASPAPAARE